MHDTTPTSDQMRSERAGGRLRASDETSAGLGPREAWPQPLQTAADLCLALPDPAAIFWGPERVQISNNAWEQAVAGAGDAAGTRSVLNQALDRIWADGAPVVLPRASARESAEGGSDREVGFTFHAAPIRDEAGKVGGALVCARETAPPRADTPQQVGPLHEALVAALPGGAAFVVDHDLRYLLADEEALRTAGMTPSQFIGKTLAEVLPPALLERGEALYRRALGGETFSEEHKEGERTYVSHAAPLRNADGTVYAALIVSYDVSGRRATEDALRQSEERFRATFEQANVGIVQASVDGAIQIANPGFCKILGYSEVEIRRLTVRDITHPDDYEGDMEQARRVVAGEMPGYTVEKRYVRKDGQIVWAQMTSTLIRHPNGEPFYALAIIEDITERRRAEATLRESEAKQSYLLKLGDRIRPLTDPVEIQAVACRTLGEQLEADRAYYVEINEASREFIVARDWHQPGAPSHARRYPLEDWLMPWLSDGQTWVMRDVDSDAVLPDEQRAAYRGNDIRAAIVVPLIKEGRPVATFVVNQNAPRPWKPEEVELVRETAERTWAAVERARAEEALAGSEEKYRALFDSIDEGVSTFEVVFDENGEPIDLIFIENNPAFTAVTGLSADVIGKRTSEVVPNLERFWIETYGRVVKTGISERFESSNVDTDGNWYNVYASRVGGEGSRKVVIVYNNITERKQRERQQEFLLKLSDALRPLSDAEEIEITACRVLGEWLGAHRVYYVEILESEGIGRVSRLYLRADAASIAGDYPIAAFDWAAPPLRRGEAVVVSDVRHSDRVPPEYVPAMEAVQQTSVVLVPLVKEGEWLGVLAVGEDAPRDWKEEDAALARETLERMWAAAQRARAEGALRESEEKFRTLFESIDEGFLIHEMIRDESGQAVDFRLMEVNPAFTRQTGLGTEVVGKLNSEFLPNLEKFWLDTFDRVARTGTPERFENYNQATDRWYNVHASRVGGQDRRVAVVFEDITERKRRERQQEFILKFSDALRAETNADDVANRALLMLSEELSLDRCYIGVYRLEDDRADLTHQVGNERVPPLPGSIRLSDFPEAFQVVFNRTLVIEDFAETEGLSDTDKQNIAALGLRALVAPSLRKGENKPLWTIVAVSASPRRWTRGEIALLEEASERTWAAVERARAEAALRESDERFRTMADNAPVLLWETDHSGAIFVNQHYLDFFGVDFDAVRQMGWAEFLHPDDLAGYFGAYQKAFAEREPYVYECRLRRADGEYRWFLNTGRPLGEDRFVGFSADITENKRAEEALRASEERLQKAISIETVGVLFFDTDGTFSDANDAFLSMSGFRREQIEARRLDVGDITLPEWMPRVRQAIDELMTMGHTAPYEKELRRPDGSRWWGLCAATRLAGEGRASEYVEFIVDITEQKRAEASVQEALQAVARANEELEARVRERTRALSERTEELARMSEMRQELFRELVTAQEQERARISRDLHDDTGQQVTALLLGLSNLAVAPGVADNPQAQATLRHLQALTGDVAQKSHRLSFTLRPTALDDIGLMGALANYTEQWSHWSGLPIDLQSVGMEGSGDGRLPREIETTIYRVTQEALTNVLRHAVASSGESKGRKKGEKRPRAATGVTVLVQRTRREVVTIIEDDGPGFDVDATLNLPPAKRRLGIFGMQERARLAGGTLTVQSAPDEGTTVFLRLPLPDR